MVSLRIISLTSLTLTVLIACQTKPNKEKLQQLVKLTSNFSEKEFCATQINEPNNIVTDKIQSLLSDLDYDCCTIYNQAKGEMEDSVLVLTKRQPLEVQTLYYDFANRKRELKTWNYPNAAEKKVKIEDRIYLQTSGFD
jgi:hypothetical protein